ncbi:hypothetical protein F4778DRAFT_741013 [Xylariomycetidae sp. FL2044]|nr:hypothetical protein F4778DRAFT_741013 [Xylariomycetidae sp. FL2044]
MERHRQKLSCQIDCDLVFVNMDMAWDVDLVCLNYITLRGWYITSWPNGDGYVIPSDRRSAKIFGYVDMALGIGTVARQKRF